MHIYFRVLEKRLLGSWIMKEIIRQWGMKKSDKEYSLWCINDKCERLSNEDYEKRAEENMINIIRENT